VEESTTRLILRARFNVGPRLFWQPYLPLILPADFFVARLMLCTIKQRVEGRRRQAPERVEGTTPHQVRQDESLV
jgi:hypothetical protein